MAGHVERQRAPAAAGFYYALAGAELEFAADVVELGFLRGF